MSSLTSLLQGCEVVGQAPVLRLAGYACQQTPVHGACSAAPALSIAGTVQEAPITA